MPDTPSPLLLSISEKRTSGLPDDISHAHQEDQVPNVCAYDGGGWSSRFAPQMTLLPFFY
jgi:hypothetical protein